MTYVILYDGAEGDAVTARHARDALVMAEDLAAHGGSDVRVKTPEGEVYPLRQFATLLREGSL